MNLIILDQDSNEILNIVHDTGVYIPAYSYLIYYEEKFIDATSEDYETFGQIY